MELTTLCYIEKDDSYLMLHRVSKKNDVNKDKWIGVGEDCLLREVKEETGLMLTSYRFRGLLTFVFNDNEAEYICLYTADGFEGEITDCDEGTLEWVSKKKIPELNLWEGDKIFFELLNRNEPFFSMKLVYQGDTLVDCELNGEKILTRKE